ncbi:MAG: polyribonucleotide nucleotidyltransferase [Bdellovibrionaceae bacterium]|nr:polyribonucleotide nucleotidyltransferase [Pseudobdellovibrionaceae bacterium]
MVHKVTTTIAGQQITVETGKIARQADGAALVTCGNNMVLVTVVSSRKPSEMDFFPLTVEFLEKYYAAGKFPGGFFKREAKPTTDATLSARQIDRPIRPCFPEGYRYETQVVATVLSYDGQYSVEVLASLGASAALHISDIPFNGPTATIQVTRADGKFIVNPTPEQIAASDMEVVIAGTRNGILMVEGETHLVSEADFLAALKFGHEQMKPLFDMQDELRAKVGNVAKREFTPFTVNPEFRTQVESAFKAKIEDAITTREKNERYSKYQKISKEAVDTLIEGKGLNSDEIKLRKKELNMVLEDLKYTISRKNILDKGSRIDGRDLTTVRPIACEVNLLPRVHGSALFTRGETQVLGALTLGTGEDEQMIDGLNRTFKKKFILHYNFPPYSVGEVGRMSGTSRRELGHGNLAERALKPMLPDSEKFPYTIRLVGEVLESNGSSSMGTVCAGTMALLDAGVPIKAPVAGIAMGLISDGKNVAILTDILGDEDHLGDMDFKVAGTKEGVTAVQMDIKIDSISFDVMEKALNQAKAGRLHILDEMSKAISAPKGQLSPFAPRIEVIKIKPEKVREVIGAGGKVIKGIIEETGVKMDIADDGTVRIASTDPLMSKRAIEIIEGICAEAEVGRTYKGKVVKIVDFGAFVEFLPGNQGLLHISEISNERIRNVTDVLKEGEEVDVKVIEVDRSGRVKLSRKAILSASASTPPQA